MFSSTLPPIGHLPPSAAVAALALACAGLTLPTPTTAQVVTMKYVVNNLGNLKGIDGTPVVAFALNEAGQVVGQSQTADGATRAFRTAPNRAIRPGDDLGTLGGPSSAAYAINNLGQVVGDADTALAGPFGSVVRRAFRLDPGGAMIDLGTLAATGGANGYNNSGARGIGDNGVVVGSATVPANSCGSSSRAYRTFPNTEIRPGFDDLGTLIGHPNASCRSSIAWGTNNVGTVVGDSATNVVTGFPNHAWRWAPFLGIIDLGTLGGRDSQAFAVNDRGEVVGQSQVPADPVNNPYNNPHAFISQGTLVPVMTDLGTLGGSYSSATGINNRDPYDSQVVGAASTAGDAAFHAFLWTGNAVNGGTMIDLNTRVAAGSGWELTRARAINNKGQIVADARRTDAPFIYYAVRLDPSDAAVAVLIETLSDPQYGLSAAQVNVLTQVLTGTYNAIRQGLVRQATLGLRAAIGLVRSAVLLRRMTPATGDALIGSMRAILDTLQ